MSASHAVLAAAVVFILAGTAQAQDRVRVELTPGVLFPTEQVAATDLDTGFGAGANVSVRVLPRLSPYVGWDWRRWRGDTLLGTRSGVEETGYAFGVRYDQPLGGAAPTLFVRGGGTYTHFEIENAAGDVVADSGHGLGWEVGAGLAIPLGSRWHVAPGVRFRSVQRDVDFGVIRRPVSLRYVALEVGLSRGF
jgi:hypothetical protein